MLKPHHEGQSFESAEQREFLDWVRRIGGALGGGRAEKPLVAQKGIGAAIQRIAPQVTRAVAAAKRGTPPEKVCWVQNVLNKTMGEALVEDGLYGPLTRAGVTRFQTRHALAADGIVGSRTEVALIQAALNEVAQASLVPVNGVLDPQTTEQIRRFQSQRNLVTDGIVGPRTRAAMVAALGGKCKIPTPRPTPKPKNGTKPPPKPPACDPAVIAGLMKACAQDEFLCKAGCGLDGLISQIKQIPELADCAGLRHPGLIVACVLARGGVPFIDALFKAKDCWEDCGRNVEFCQLNAQRCVR
jgi:hypothetical protein